jgi:hypothetical protein
MDATEFDGELQRRLALLEDPEYHDPARADLPARDLVVLLIAAVVLIAAMLAWGYPW